METKYSLTKSIVDELESYQNFRDPLIPGEILTDSQLTDISKSAKASYRFAHSVVKGAWEPGEKAISKDPHASYYYALAVLNSPFEAGEYTIRNSMKYHYRYLRLQKKWKNV